MSRPPPLLVICLTGLAALFGILLAGISRIEPPPAAPAEFLEIGWDAPLQRTLPQGAVASFLVELRRGDYLHLVVDQRGVDLLATLSDPSGQKLLEVDSPNGAEGPEPVLTIARREGHHRLDVRSLAPGGSGPYALWIEELRPATGRDRIRVAAAEAFARGERLRARGGAGPLREALRAYRQALRAWSALEDSRSAAVAWRRIGQVSFHLGDLRGAAKSYEQALRLAREVGDPGEEARLLNELGAAYRLLGEPRASESAYTRALDLARARGDRLGEALALNNIGVLYDAQAEPRRALDAYDRALAAWRALGDRERESTTLHNLGTIYAFLGRLPEALDFSAQALQLRRAAGDRRGEAVTLAQIAWVRDLAGEPQRALDLYGEAIRLARETADPRGEAGALGRRGAILAKMGRSQEALSSYRRALQIFQAAGEPASEAHLLANLGDLCASRGDLRSALAFHQRALRLFQRVGDRHGQVRALLGLARAERQRGQLGLARSQIEEALQIIESLRDAAPSPELRMSFLAIRHQCYELAIALLMELHEREPGGGFDARAFEISERARARSLLDSVAGSRAADPSAERVQLEGRLRAARAQLNAADRERMRLAGGEAAQPRIAGAEREVLRWLVAGERLAARLHGSDLQGPAPLSLPEIQRRLLGGDTLLLEYALGEKRSFLWSVDAASVSSHVLPGRAEIEARARAVHKLLSKSQARGLQRQAQIAVDALSDAVLGPVAGRLGTRRLLIVSDGALQYVPFAALTLPAKASGRRMPLVVEHEIVHLPSASVVALLRGELAGRRPAPHQVAVLADPVFQSDDPRLRRSPGRAAPEPGAEGGAVDLERSAQDLGLAGFRRLPHSRQEAAAILSLVPASERLCALDFAASRQTVLHGGLDRYRIVHFATHGLLHPEHPELSGVVLTLVDEQGRPRDGFLRAHEIYNLRLPAELVVLSACRTALGREVRGEGLMGLMQAFLHAGAARVLVSLWNVNDEATAELMGRFYRGMLRESLPPGQALRAAQLSMLREPRWEAPCYWAGFTLQGTP